MPDILVDGQALPAQRLVGLAMSYGEPDVAWFSGSPGCVLFRQGSGVEHAEWEAAIASLGEDAFSLRGSRDHDHRHVLRASAVTEAGYEGSMLSASLRGHGRVTVYDVSPEEFRGLVAAMPADSWHTPLPGGTRHA